MAQRRGNFRALEANPINWMDGLYSTHHLSNPLEIQGVLPPQQLTQMALVAVGGFTSGPWHPFPRGQPVLCWGSVGCQHQQPARSPCREPKLLVKCPYCRVARTIDYRNAYTCWQIPHTEFIILTIFFGQRIPHGSLTKTSPLVQLACLAFKTCNRTGCIQTYTTIHVYRPSYILVCWWTDVDVHLSTKETAGTGFAKDGSGRKHRLVHCLVRFSRMLG